MKRHLHDVLAIWSAAPAWESFEPHRPSVCQGHQLSNNHTRKSLRSRSVVPGINERIDVNYCNMGWAAQSGSKRVRVAYNNAIEFCITLSGNRDAPEMSGLSYFTIHIQSWIFKTQCKFNHSSKKLKHVKSKPKWSPWDNKIQLFNNKNAVILFQYLCTNPVLIPNFWSDLQSGWIQIQKGSL